MATVTTPAQVCNLALLRVGQRQLIDSLDENSLQARTCKALYATARDSALEACWWPFATRRANLPLTNSTRSGWGYVYTAPADCLQARYIYSGSRTPSAANRIAFSLELNDTGNGRIICTDQQAPELVYTAQLTTEALWPGLFVNAMAWRLAVELCLALPIKPQVALAMDRGLEKAMAAAIATAMREGQEDAEPDSEFVTIRG